MKNVAFCIYFGIYIPLHVLISCSLQGYLLQCPNRGIIYWSARRYSSVTVVQPLLLVCGKQNGLCIHMDLISLPKAYLLFLTHTVNSVPASTNSWANWQITSEFKGSVHRSKWTRNGNTEIPAAAPTPQAYSAATVHEHIYCATRANNEI